MWHMLTRKWSSSMGPGFSSRDKSERRTNLSASGKRFSVSFNLPLTEVSCRTNMVDSDSADDITSRQSLHVLFSNNREASWTCNSQIIGSIYPVSAFDFCRRLECKRIVILPNKIVTHDAQPPTDTCCNQFYPDNYIALRINHGSR